MTNPLLQKYDEIYNPKVEEPKPEPTPSYPQENRVAIQNPYPQENRVAIQNLELLLKDLKTGKAIYQEHEVKPNYRCLPPMNPLDIDYSQPYLSPRYLNVYEGDLITFTIFRRTR